MRQPLQSMTRNTVVNVQPNGFWGQGPQRRNINAEAIQIKPTCRSRGSSKYRLVIDIRNHKTSHNPKLTPSTFKPTHKLKKQRLAALVEDPPIKAAHLVFPGRAFPASYRCPFTLGVRSGLRVSVLRFSAAWPAREMVALSKLLTVEV